MTPTAIRQLRERLGLTQDQFAQALGLHGKTHLSRWENGRAAPTGTALRLLELFAESPALVRRVLRRLHAA